MPAPGATISAILISAEVLGSAPAIAITGLSGGGAVEQCRDALLDVLGRRLDPDRALAAEQAHRRGFIGK